jgi:hypothetical protein
MPTTKKDAAKAGTGKSKTVRAVAVQAKKKPAKKG